MSQKVLAPFKKIPEKVQNSALYKRILEGKGKDSLKPNTNWQSQFGYPSNVISAAHDDILDLLAVGTSNGQITICGKPGVQYIFGNGKSCQKLLFLKEQGRLLSLCDDNRLYVWEYDVYKNIWFEKCSTSIPKAPEDISITCFEVGHTTRHSTSKQNATSDDSSLTKLTTPLFIGTSNSEVHVLVIEDGQMCFCDKLENSCFIIPQTISERTGRSEDLHVGAVKFMLAHPAEPSYLLVGFQRGTTILLKTAFSEATTCEVTLNGNVNGTDCEVAKAAAVGTSGDTEEGKKTENKSDDDANKEAERKAVVVEADGESERSLPHCLLSFSFTIAHCAYAETLVTGGCWETSTSFLVSCASGSYTQWCVPEGEPTADDPCVTLTPTFGPHRVNGPFPCTMISAICASDNHYGGKIVAFSGGLTRCSFGDRNSVSVHAGNHSWVLTTKGKVLYLQFLRENPTKPLSKVVKLLVVTSLEVFLIDLLEFEWAKLRLPYLTPLSTSSTIATISQIVQVPEAIFCALKRECEDCFSLSGGKINTSNEADSSDDLIDVVASGHFDGSLNFWHIKQGGCISHLGYLEIAKLLFDQSKASEQNVVTSLGNDAANIREADLSDASKASILCKLSLFRAVKTLKVLENVKEEGKEEEKTIETEKTFIELYVSVGFKCGLAFLLNFSTVPAQESTVNANSKCVKASIFNEEQMKHVVWIGSCSPKLQSRDVKIDGSNVSVVAIIQCYPPSPITCFEIQPEWQLALVGTTHGFFLYDLKLSQIVHAATTISFSDEEKPNAGNPAGSGARTKLRRTFRQSFRKLKKLRPHSKQSYNVEAAGGKDEKATAAAGDTKRQAEEEATATTEQKITSSDEKVADKNAVVKELMEAEAPKCSGDKATEDSAKVEDETAVEAEADFVVEISEVDEGCAVTCGVIATTSIATFPVGEMCPCLLIATEAGTILAYKISDLSSEPLSLTLCKTLQLQHGAAVLDMRIIARANNSPLLDNNETSGGVERRTTKRQEKEEIEPEETDEVATATEKTSEKEEAVTSDDNEQKAKQRSSVDNTVKVETEAKNECRMKKSGTLPPSLIQAAHTIRSHSIAQIQASTGVGETHELLVCSQEQIKLFGLPSFVQRHKHKAVDTGHHKAGSRLPTSASTAFAKQHRKDVHATPTKKADETVPNEKTNEILPADEPRVAFPLSSDTDGQKEQADEEVAVATTQVCEEVTVKDVVPKSTARISAFGFQKMPRGKCGASEKWICTIVCTDGMYTSLNLANLKKITTEKVPTFVTDEKRSFVVCNDKSRAILAWSDKQDTCFVISEMGYSLKRQIPTRYRSTATIDLPVWSRVQEVKVASDENVEAVVENVDVKENEAGPTGIAEEAQQQASDECVVPVETANINNSGTFAQGQTGATQVHFGDDTLGPIKEYIKSGEGNVTVKTTEQTFEKRTVIEGGKVSTTVHETETIDGKLVRDEKTSEVNETNNKAVGISA